MYSGLGNGNTGVFIAAMMLALILLGLRGMPTPLGTIVTRIFALISIAVTIPEIIRSSCLGRKPGRAMQE